MTMYKHIKNNTEYNYFYDTTIKWWIVTNDDRFGIDTRYFKNREHLLENFPDFKFVSKYK